MSIEWPRFVERIAANQRFLLTSHIRPDADALGSELGMAGVLDALGKDVTIVNGHGVPRNLKFLDPRNRIKVIGTDFQVADLIENFDVHMVLDTSAWAQLGDMGQVIRETKARKIVLDHHVSADDLGAEEFKDTQAEATGRLVFDAARALGVTVGEEIAMPLFAALATDTGWFRFGSTSGDTLRTAAALVDAGANPADIYRELHEQDTLARLQLVGRILARATAELEGRLIHTAVLREDFQATDAAPSDTEDIINLTLTVAGTEAAVILVEQATGAFKVSFRSRGKMDCSRVAELFGGGGHRAAAGATIDGPFEIAQAKVLDAVRAAV